MTNLQKALDVLTRLPQTEMRAVNELTAAVRAVSADALKTLLEQEATIARLTAELEEARAQNSSITKERDFAVAGNDLLWKVLKTFMEQDPFLADVFNDWLQRIANKNNSEKT